MKILFVNSVYNWGSTGKIVRTLSDRCRADGIETAVCYGRTMTDVSPQYGDNIFKFGIDGETKLHALLTRLTGRTGCFSYFSTCRLIEFMDEFKPDVVNIHEPHAYFLNLRPFFEYLRLHNIPIVYTFHCEFAFTGRCGFSDTCDRWKTGCGCCPRMKEYPSTLFFDASASMLKEKEKLLSGQKMCIVTPSKWLADNARQSFLRDYPIYVVPNGIDTENVFYPRDTKGLREKLGLKDEKLVLSVSDYTDPRKGTDRLIKLAESLRGENVKIILVGKGSDRYSFPDNVIKIGRTENQQELAEFYSLADCFVICSEMENLPTTCLESVCCGTPVAGFDVGGTAETAPGELGRFTKRGDIEALRENVLYYIENRPDSAVFEKQREKYSVERMYEEYRRIYFRAKETSK